MNTKSKILLRVYLSFVFFVVMALAITVQIVNIQYSQGEYWRGLADSLTTNLVEIEPVRGNIYSYDEKLLVTSLPIYEVRIDFKTKGWADYKYYSSNIDSLTISLADYFKDKSAGEYKRIISKAKNQGHRYYLLKRNINHHQLKEIRQFPFFRLGRNRGGFIVENRSRRIYPFNLLAKRTLGMKNPNVKGVGLERAYNEYLEGQSGKRLMQKISGGNWVPVSYKSDVEPEDGKDLVSTIDINIQDVTEDALLKAMKKHNADNGCAVVMEVKTGHIKAIANLEKVESGEFYETYNYAIGASREPGSTFKLATAIVLIENEKVKLNQLIDTKEGEYEFFDRVMKDAKPYGKLTFQRAFELSSNVAFSVLTYKNYYGEPHKFINELKKLHITEPLEIPISGEGIPYFKNPDSSNWSGTTLPWMSIGYELQVTPLQTLTLYNAIANHGKMVKPLFATEIIDVGNQIQNFETEVIDNKICSKKTIEWLDVMLRGVVERGTAKNIKTSLYKIAGKTGTNLIASSGSYEHEEVKKYQASFVGYFPADNPKYSCIVVVNNPDASKGSVYGGLVAGPVFRKIADKLYANDVETYYVKNKKINYRNFPIVKYGNKNDLITLSKYLGISMKHLSGQSNWVYISASNKALVLKEKTINEEIVPDVKGMVLSDAIYILENIGLKVKIKGFGKVKGQSLSPGTKVEKNKVIELKLS